MGFGAIGIGIGIGIGIVGVAMAGIDGGVVCTVCDMTVWT